MTEPTEPNPTDPARASRPAVAPLQSGERRVFFSPPVMRTSILLSIMLAVVFFGLWFALDAEIRALFTAPQIGTLIFFMVVMWAIMLGLGFSRLVLTSEGVSVRNWFITRRFAWNEVEGVSFGSGDPWAYLRLTPDMIHTEGRHHLVLGIQRAEGDAALERVREVEDIIRAQHAALGITPRDRLD